MSGIEIGALCVVGAFLLFAAVRLFRGPVKLALRTGPRVNATEVCRLLGGGGHAAAAGATVSGTMAQAKSAGLAAIAQVIGPLAP